MTTVQQKLIDAIANKQVLQYEYDGHQRVVMPAAVGRNVNTGNDLVRVFQIRGGSKSGRPLPVWELHQLSKIRHLNPTGEVFSATPPGYRRADSALDIIFAEL